MPWFAVDGVAVAEAFWEGKVLVEKLIKSRELGSFDYVIAISSRVFAKSKAMSGVFSRSCNLAQGCAGLGRRCGLSSLG